MTDDDLASSEQAIVAGLLLAQSGHFHRNDFRRLEMAESMFGRCTIAAAGGNAIVSVAGFGWELWP
jgi:uncharacterized cupin superfamily protein